MCITIHPSKKGNQNEGQEDPGRVVIFQNTNQKFEVMFGEKQIEWKRKEINLEVCVNAYDG